MTKPRDVISYLEMCSDIGVNLQKGMNYRLQGTNSVILMSLRPNAPYADRIEDNGRILIYEGHDIAKTKDSPVPKTVDQPMNNPSGTLTQNGLFYEGAKRFKNRQQTAEHVRVYEKLFRGIWVYNGMFKLTDAWNEEINSRKVFKFKLELNNDISPNDRCEEVALDHDRMIPPHVKLEVWKRDKGQCRICGANTNLHFDHIIPFSKGGTSLIAENIQLLCAKHNLSKRDKIE